MSADSLWAMCALLLVDGATFAFFTTPLLLHYGHLHPAWQVAVAGSVASALGSVIQLLLLRYPGHLSGRVLPGAGDRARHAASRRAAQTHGGRRRLLASALRTRDPARSAALLLRARLDRPGDPDPDLDPGRGRRGDRGGRGARSMAQASGADLVSASRRTSDSPAATAVGVDTGGTFTDFVARVGGRWIAFKLPSTPRAPERAVLEGLVRVGATRATRVRHGSTLATNTLLERKGARVAFLTNRGFEDLLEIGRQDRPDLYALAPRRVPPLVPRSMRLGVRVRRGPDGEAHEPLTAREARRAIRALARARPEAVAIGLLHAYAAPEDERRLARAARRLGAPVSVSSEICPEIREFERFATTVVNAYLQPRVTRYLEALGRACGPGLEIVLSHGGGASARRAAAEPVRA
ncbi:MAG: hypothetical protein E6K80_10005 [Candidatus Eisenbacteria bacterium]|uniref:Hydantoinase/oxoprolinase N-terminal domain-containing protein n=1 Tax=Eiseniibacteriota bacterium TaxID=2212470 RepID=A0A538U238_UNCEI|nr:MAG: hypothetical protein E6K80_10005 [Candidatus Eisenbacteria bacterium]